MLLVLVIIAVLVAAILFGQLLSSRLFWIIVFGLMVASYIGGRAAGDDADAILQSMPAKHERLRSMCYRERSLPALCASGA